MPLAATLCSPLPGAAPVADDGILRIVRAEPQPLLFAAVVDLLARHRPFADYSLAVTVPRIKRQLQQRSAVIALQGQQAVGYMGGVQVKEADAKRWREQRGSLLPTPDWETGDAMVITIVVTDQPRLLRRMARSFARLYPNHRGYWKRVYTDGRPDSWRVPYGSRRP